MAHYNAPIIIGVEPNGSGLFGSYVAVAAEYSNKELLTYLMTYGVSAVNEKLRDALFRHTAQAGRMDIVNFLYFFNKDEAPWRFGDQLNDQADTLSDALNTYNIHVLRFVEALRRIYCYRKPRRFRDNLGLIKCAKTGHLNTVAHLIRLGVHPKGASREGSPNRTNEPVIRPCLMGRVAVIDFLREHGASHKMTIAAAARRGDKKLVRKLLDKGVKPVDAWPEAIAGGSIQIVRLLLDAGMNANENVRVYKPLVKAIALEHTTMFNLLLERGADLKDADTARDCVRRARIDGLDSMLSFLKGHGVDTEY